MFRNVLLFLLIFAAIMLAMRFVRKPRRLFEIRVTEDDVEVLGPIPNRSQAEVRDYLRTLRLPVGAQVTGVAKGEDFELQFSASVRSDDRERVRLFIRGQLLQ